MSFNDAEAVLNVLAAIRKQTEKEEIVREAMLVILNQGGAEDDEIPQNFDFGAVIRNLMKTEEDVFSAIHTLDLDYLKIGEYKCFKVDDESSGVEEIYFISPTETLYLEHGCLGIF